MTGSRVQDRSTGAQGVLLNEHTAPVAVVQFEDLPGPTWADWTDLVEAGNPT
jgi:hypothetical protein